MGQSVIKHGIYHNKSFWVQSMSLFYLPFKMLKISSVKSHLLKGSLSAHLRENSKIMVK